MKAGALGLTVAACASLAQQGTVIRTETRIVLVDTIVTDKNGRYLHDLTAKDFHVFQDNKEQTIRSVSRLSGSAGTAAAGPQYTVLFFAGMEAAHRSAARRSFEGFIDANTGESGSANRLMSVVSYNGGLRVGQNFTADPGRLKEALDKVETYTTSLAGNDAGALGTIRSLRILAGNLGTLPGRKTVLFVSGGLPLSSAQKEELQEAIDTCNRSDVAVYPVDVRPLSSARSTRGSVRSAENATDADEAYPAPSGRYRRGGLGGAPPGQRGDADTIVDDTGIPNQQVLFRLASGTGGTVVSNAADLERGLQKIGEEQSEYYVLSYTPPEKPPNAKETPCHALRVKVDRAGTAVRARTSYCNEKPQDLLAGTSAGQALEKKAASAQAGGIAAPMQLSYFYSSAAVARVNLALEIPTGALKSGNREIDFLGIASAADGGTGARFSDVLKLDPAAVAGKALHYEKEFRIAPGTYTFTLAFSSGGESFGKIEAPLAVEPRQPGELALSGLVFSREIHPVAEMGLAIAGLTESRTPLVTADMQVVPSGSNTFGKSEAGFVYLEAYSKDPASVRVRPRVLDRKTGEPKWDPGLMKLDVAKADGERIPSGVALPLNVLAPGAYEFEIMATDSGGKPVRRAAAFEVR